MLVRFFFLSSFLCVVHTVVYSRKKEMNAKNQGHCSGRQRIHWSHDRPNRKVKDTDTISEGSYPLLKNYHHFYCQNQTHFHPLPIDNQATVPWVQLTCLDRGHSRDWHAQLIINIQHLLQTCSLINLSFSTLVCLIIVLNTHLLFSKYSTQHALIR